MVMDAEDEISHKLGIILEDFSIQDADGVLLTDDVYSFVFCYTSNSI